VLVLYGSCGFIVAINFWRVFREHPDEHPKVDDGERALIRQGESEAHLGKASFPPIYQLVSSGSMWLMSTLQFGINVGWVFLVTLLPTYLKEVKNVDPKVGGLMSTIVLTAGIVGMLCGGQLTDHATRRLGRRWGRTLPMLICYILAIAAYISCMHLESAWAFIAAASLVAFATDVSVPAIWAYMQDVGGKNTAAVFGWGNMWGNLGAATLPILVPYVRSNWDTNGDWHEVFWLLAAGYLVACLAALGINANRRIE
jgi:nitrate/nitrite transporter NarK